MSDDIAADFQDVDHAADFTPFAAAGRFVTSYTGFLGRGTRSAKWRRS